MNWKILDRSGHVIALHERVDLGKGKKKFTWLHPDGAPSKNGEIHSTDKLYGLELLDRKTGITRILLVEGEKAADALRRLGFVALGLVCGANSTPNREILANLVGRTVTLWPDADPPTAAHPQGPGQELMLRVATILHELGIEVEIATWTGAPEKGDAADLIFPGLGPEEIKTAVPQKSRDEVRAALQIVRFEPTPTVIDGRPFKLQKVESDPPVYLMSWPTEVEEGRFERVPGGKILRLSASQLTEHRQVRTQWLIQLRGSPPWAPDRTNTWIAMVDTLVGQMTEEDYLQPPPELTLMGRVRAMIIHLCGSTPPDDPSSPRAKPDRLDVGDEWWDLSSGKVYFKLNRLIRDHFMNTAPGDRLTRPQIVKAIMDLGGQTSVRIERPDKEKGEKGWRERVSWVQWEALAEDSRN